MTNPAECKSIDMAHTPFKIAFNAEGNVFTWFREPSNASRLVRFNAAMRGSRNAASITILNGKLFSVPLLVILVLTVSSVRLEFGY